MKTQFLDLYGEMIKMTEMIEVLIRLLIKNPLPKMIHSSRKK